MLHFATEEKKFENRFNEKFFIKISPNYRLLILIS